MAGLAHVAACSFVHGYLSATEHAFIIDVRALGRGGWVGGGGVNTLSSCIVLGFVELWPLHIYSLRLLGRLRVT